MARMNRGRRRTRPPVRRVTLELEEALLVSVEATTIGGTDPLRAIVEAGLRLWLEQQAAQVVKQS